MSAEAGAPRHGTGSARTSDPLEWMSAPRSRARRVGACLGARSCTSGRPSANPTAARPGRASAPRGAGPPRSADWRRGTSVAGSGPHGAAGRHPRPRRTARPTPARSLRGRSPRTRCRNSRRAASGNTTPGDPSAATAPGPPRRRPSGAGRRSGPVPESGPAAPRCGGPRGPAAGRSQRSGRGAPPDAGPVFETRPIGLPPRGDRVRVALAGDARGLLRGEAAVAAPRAEIPGVEPDAERLVDQGRPARPGPEVGREPVLRRLVGHPPADDLLLGDRQLGRPSRRGAGEETLPTLLPVRGDPTPHRAGVDPEELGNLPGGVPIEDPLHGAESAVFQLRWRSFVSHTRE